MDTEKILLEKSLTDLEEDIDQLLHVASSAAMHLDRFNEAFLLGQNRIIFRQAKKFYSDTLRDLKSLKKNNGNKGNLLQLYRNLLNSKNRYYNLLRQMQSVVSTLLTSADFQSPSFMHSLSSQAGKQTGKIIGTINDYKRDVHLDESEFEKMFVRQYVDANWKILTHSYLVNSGMAAFTTILTYLTAEKKLDGNILVGNSSYFQYKQILSGIFGKKIIGFDEADSRKLCNLIKTKHPKAVFVDSLCNSKKIPVLDLKNLMKCLGRCCKKETYLVLDNTCLSVFCQPFKMLLRNQNIRLIVFESLNKYFQFGLDRVTAGIITAVWKDGHKIFEYRKHAGTNISDASVYALPRPNRKLLEKRLLRHQRNAEFLYAYLQDKIGTKANKIIEYIIYPKVPDHPCYNWTKDMKFTGSFLNLKFRKKFENKKHYQKFIKSAIDRAKKQNADLIAGTSFGLNTSRIYLTSLWTDYGDPFFRVSAGTEDLLSVRKLGKVISETINEYTNTIR